MLGLSRVMDLVLVKGHDPFNSPIVAFVFPLLDLGFLSSYIINIISTGMTLNKAMSFHSSTAAAQDGTSTLMCQTSRSRPAWLRG
jgi:hypothetical protein